LQSKKSCRDHEGGVEIKASALVFESDGSFESSSSTAAGFSAKIPRLTGVKSVKKGLFAVKLRRRRQLGARLASTQAALRGACLRGLLLCDELERGHKATGV
jgi:hypothetical protein